MQFKHVSDLSGSQDGCVRLWEWGHTQSLATARQAGSFPKVTKVQFNAQGNKVCCIVGETLCLHERFYMISLVISCSLV